MKRERLLLLLGAALYHLNLSQELWASQEIPDGREDAAAYATYLGGRAYTHLCVYVFTSSFVKVRPSERRRKQQQQQQSLLLAPRHIDEEI